jgi:hypothetical protein
MHGRTHFDYKTMVLVSVTRFRLRSWRQFPGFIVETARIVLQARATPGCVAGGLLWDANRVFWTTTSWSDAQAMRAFMLAGAHKPAMRYLRVWSDEAAFVTWTQAEAQSSDWREAHRRMQQEGRRSKVDQPSDAHTAFVIAPPAAWAGKVSFKAAPRTT